MATAIPTINSLIRLPSIVKEAIMSHIPNRPTIQFRHIMIDSHPEKSIQYRKAISIPESLKNYLREYTKIPLNIAGLSEGQELLWFRDGRMKIYFGIFLFAFLWFFEKPLRT